MIYTYVNMYIAFVTPVMDVRLTEAAGLKMGVENSILVRLRFGEPGGTHPPRNLLILFYLYL